MMANTIRVSLAEVNSIIASPPMNISMLRRNQETEDPITERISVVSVVMRLITSPVSRLSK